MSTGLAAGTLAQKWFDMLSGTAFTAPAGAYAQLHTADPGAAGTTSPCSGASSAGTRKSITYSAASTVTTTTTKAMSNTPSWTTWDGTSVTISHISSWDAAGSGNPASGGNFLFTGQLGTAKPITNGDTFNLTSLSLTLSPIAA